MHRSVRWIASVSLAMALAATASVPARDAASLMVAAPEHVTPLPPVGSRSGSFGQSTITVKVAGSRDGTQTGPFSNFAFSAGDRGKTLTIHLDQVATATGEALPQTPVHLYQSLVGPVTPGQELIAFLDPPFRTATEVVADRGRGTLAWSIEPGDYFVFFPQTRPIVRVPRETQPATVSYTVRLE